MFASVGTFQTDEQISSELFVYECGYEDVKPREPYQYNHIDYYLLHYIFAGEGLFFINGNVHRLKRGDGFFIPPHTDNNYYPLHGNPWSYRWIGLKGSRCPELLEKCGFTAENYLFHYDKDETVGELFADVFKSCQSGKLYQANGVVYNLLQHLMDDQKEALRYTMSDAEHYVTRVLDIIHENYHQSQLTIQDLATSVQIERTYLFKLFKQYVTLSPQQYLIQFRLNKAMELLRKTNFSIDEISFLVGFSSVSHFSKQFSKHKGLSPMKYRSKFIRK